MSNVRHHVTNPTEILADYESGLYTRVETECRLVGLAAERDPAEFLAEVPARWVEAIRSMDSVKSPPATVEEIVVLSGRLYRRGIDVSAAIRSEQQETFKSLWAMHQYFYGEKGSR